MTKIGRVKTFTMNKTVYDQSQPKREVKYFIGIISFQNFRKG